MGKKHSPQFERICNEARACICEISRDELKDRLACAHLFYLIDVRDRCEWEEGRLPKAIHLSKGVIERDIEVTISDVDAEIVCYCGGGYRSALVAVNLERMGYTRIWSLEGGYRGWCEAGLPIVHG